MRGIVIESLRSKFHLTIHISRCRDGIRRHISREMDRVIPGEVPLRHRTIELVTDSGRRWEIVELRPNPELLRYLPSRRGSVDAARRLLQRLLVEVVPPLVQRRRIPSRYLYGAVRVDVSLWMSPARIERAVIQMYVVDS